MLHINNLKQRKFMSLQKSQLRLSRVNIGQHSSQYVTFYWPQRNFQKARSYCVRKKSKIIKLFSETFMFTGGYYCRILKTNVCYITARLGFEVVYGQAYTTKNMINSYYGGNTTFVSYIISKFSTSGDFTPWYKNNIYLNVLSWTRGMKSPTMLSKAKTSTSAEITGSIFKLTCCNQWCYWL